MGRLKADMGRVREEKRTVEKKREDQRYESQKQEEPTARQGGKVAKHYVSTSRLAKTAGAELSGRMMPN